MTKAILIAGPTASGKSAMALDWAKKTGGFIVNTDSMQIYSGLDIITAAPTAADRAQADHHLYSYIAPDQSYSTGQWLRDVETLLAQPQFEGRIPIFTGGTGLYFRALLGGLSPIPHVTPDIREHWRAQLKIEGSAALHALLQERDAAMAAQLNPMDGQRIVRALEIWQATGKSLLYWQAQKSPALIEEQQTQAYVLMPDRVELRARIAQRFNQMMHLGALDEVKQLLEQKLDPQLPAMKAIGVRQLSAYLDGDLSLEQAIEQAIIASSQYAKRQMTWFRHQLSKHWQVL